MTDNLKIWDALGKTDPKHTKPFNRAGGFKGTAIKPIWILRGLTEQFGPAGIGWGVNEPRFEVVQADGEILVYCTVSAWHGNKDNILWGVGGDKVQAKRSGGSFCDDEAFKKAFTDAVNNAFKSIGVGADVHMGQFDDDKYVAAVGREFEEQARADEPKVEMFSDDQRDIIAGLAPAAGLTLQQICEGYKVASLKDLPASKFDALRNRLDQLIQKKSQKEAA